MRDAMRRARQMLEHGEEEDANAEGGVPGVPQLPRARRSTRKEDEEKEDDGDDEDDDEALENASGRTNGIAGEDVPMKL